VKSSTIKKKREIEAAITVLEGRVMECDGKADTDQCFADLQTAITAQKAKVERVIAKIKSDIKKGLGTGVVIAIIAVVLIVLGGIIAAVIIIMKRRKLSREGDEEEAVLSPDKK